MVETNITSEEQKKTLLERMALFFAEIVEPGITQHYQIKIEGGEKDGNNNSN